MSRQKTPQELSRHKQQALAKMEAYLDSLITSGNPKDMGKSDKLCYWLEDWCTFLDFESKFSPRSLRRYKRGEIIKVHLGFNVGSEEGGLHYAVVLDKNNAKSSPVVTIVPLTSVKPTTDTNNLRDGSVFLGNELFTNLNAKVSSTTKQLTSELDLLLDIVKSSDASTSDEEKEKITERVNTLQDNLYLLARMKQEVMKMKIGSIALINQITTVSKIRIYDPKTDHDVLSGIKLSNEKLDLIDAEIQRKFIKS